MRTSVFAGIAGVLFATAAAVALLAAAAVVPTANQGAGEAPVEQLPPVTVRPAPADPLEAWQAIVPPGSRMDWRDCRQRYSLSGAYHLDLLCVKRST